MVAANYYQHHFKLSENQLNNVIHAIKNTESIALRLNKDNYENGNIVLPLTKTDAMKVINKKAFTYDLNKAKLKVLTLEEKEGGFLPLILPAVGALLGLGTLITTGVKTVIDSKAKNAELEEQKRHNEEIEKAAKGEALTLRPWKEGLALDIKSLASKSKLDKVGQKTFKSMMKNLQDNFQISYDGSALTLRPWTD
jgi:hypothetical protein